MTRGLFPGSAGLAWRMFCFWNRELSKGVDKSSRRDVGLKPELHEPHRFLDGIPTIEPMR